MGSISAKPLQLFPMAKLGVNFSCSWETFMDLIRCEALSSMGACWLSLVDVRVIPLQVCCLLYQCNLASHMSCLFPKLRSLWHVDPSHTQEEYKGFRWLWNYCIFRVVWCQVSELYRFRQTQYVLLLSSFSNDNNMTIFFSPYLWCFEKRFPFWSRRLRQHAIPSFVQKIRQNCRPSCRLPCICFFCYVLVY